MIAPADNLDSAQTVSPADVSVVIPAYGECPHLPAVLAALARQIVRPREIIVIHTGPHDPSAELAGRDGRLTVIHQDDRLYAGAALEQGDGGDRHFGRTATAGRKRVGSRRSELPGVR